MTRRKEPTAPDKNGIADCPCCLWSVDVDCGEWGGWCGCGCQNFLVRNDVANMPASVWSALPLYPPTPEAGMGATVEQDQDETAAEGQQGERPACTHEHTYVNVICTARYCDDCGAWLGHPDKMAEDAARAACPHDAVVLTVNGVYCCKACGSELGTVDDPEWAEVDDRPPHGDRLF